MQLAFEQCLELLCCPHCKSDLERQAEGTLHCASCKHSFPIIDGIPVLLPASTAAEQGGPVERYWDSEEKAALYNQKVEGEGEEDAFGVYNHEAEIFGLLALYRDENMDVVLDAGCGNGRFLETFPETSLRIGIDASLNLLRWTKQRNRGDFLVCCELEHLPFREGTFGTVISCRVLQHLRQQKEAVLEMSRVVRDRGDVILELYNTWNPKTLYKQIRMSPIRKVLNAPFRLLFRSWSPFDDWGLDYDNYNHWFETKRWMRSGGLGAFAGRGVGFGFHKYLLEPFYIGAALQKHAPRFLRSYFRRCFALERRIGPWPLFRHTMEKFVIRGERNGRFMDGASVPARITKTLYYRYRESSRFTRVGRLELARQRQQRDILIKDDRFHLREALDWLKRAQDATPDRGVSRGYAAAWSFHFDAQGWQPSYPETTGYIIPTLFDAADLIDDTDLRRRACEMADWEIDVQMPSGAVMGGTVDRRPQSPAVFNTGQVILGWLRAYRESGERRYLDAALRAGAFLLDVQDKDGAWRRGNSLFASATSTTYNARVAWALILLGKEIGDPTLINAGEKNIRNVLSRQHENGWFPDNCLTDPDAPLLHTICYAVEGVLGAAVALDDQTMFERAIKPAAQLINAMRDDGSLPGQLDASWHGTVSWGCLTGNAQLAGIWLKLFDVSGDTAYLNAADRALTFLKSTQNCVSDDGGLRGGIKGSYPFDGHYGRFEVLSWATKFFADALIMRRRLASDATG